MRRTQDVRNVTSGTEILKGDSRKKPAGVSTKNPNKDPIKKLLADDIDFLLFSWNLPIVVSNKRDFLSTEVLINN
jgi:hypothetical protein